MNFFLRGAKLMILFVTHKMGEMCLCVIPHQLFWCGCENCKGGCLIIVCIIDEMGAGEREDRERESEGGQSVSLVYSRLTK